MPDPLSRRRFLHIAAWTAGLAAVPAGAAEPVAPVEWSGTVLGAPARLVLHHPDRAAAERLVAEVAAEARRLDGVFSLYRADSSVSRLNSRGVLVAPPRELVELIEACRTYAALSDGAFDPTVQPLWALYRDHFSQPGADPDGPAAAALREALDRVGLDRVSADLDRIVFTRRGMALTLNGIAQGFVTDRAVAILRRGGVEHALADLGEIRAVGTRGDGRPWRAGIEDTGEIAELADRAIATSAAAGFLFDPAGRFSHLLDPRSGRSPARYASVSAIMPTATAADALSTAASFMAPEAIAAALKKLGDGEIRLVERSGAHRTLGPA